MEKNIKNIRKQFKEFGVFYTPDDLTKKIKSYIKHEVKNVYDPTCGQGNLLKTFDDGVLKYGQEIDPNELEKAKQIPNFTGVAGDTLKAPAFMDMKFDCIVGNPPFSIKWEQKTDGRFPILAPASKADYAFVLHMLYMLADDGICITLLAPGVLYRGNSEGKIRQWLVENNYIDTIERIPGDAFADTTIETALVVLRKDKTSTDITFVDGNQRHVASIEEIKKNDFCLSVNRYIEKEVPKVEMSKADLWELQTQARQNFLKQLDAKLDFDKMICEFEGWDYKSFLDAIYDVLSKR